MIEGDAPIPGENFTSDTKNYPWHQPPEFSDVDDALDYLSRKITNFKVANGLLNMAEMGIPLVNITDMIVTSGIGEGKWTPDFALMIAGPLTKMIEVICVGFDVEYRLGIEEDETFVTGNFFKNASELRDRSVAGAFDVLEESMDEIKQDAEATAGTTSGLQEQGFMAMQGNAPPGGAGTPSNGMDADMAAMNESGDETAMPPGSPEDAQGMM